VQKIEISSLWDPKSWILHPASVQCLISDDGKAWKNLGTISIKDNQEKAEVNHVFAFETDTHKIRYIKFLVQGTHRLFDWHPSAGGTSWFFLDEIVVH